MKRKKLVRYILIPVALIITTLGIYGYLEFNRKQKDTAALNEDYAIKAGKLVSEFDANEKASSTKYNGKILKVEGTAKEIIKDERGFYTVVIGDSSTQSSVRCSIDSIHTFTINNLKTGRNVSIKGICSGYISNELLGSDVMLVRSVLD